MRQLRAAAEWIRALATIRGFEREMDAEMRDHIARCEATYLARGLTPAEARRAALMEFGNVGVIKEQVLDARGVRFAEHLAADVRYGLRQIRRAPAFAVTAVLILSLGIGVNAGLFTLVRAGLFGPPPGISDDRRLVLIDQLETSPRDPGRLYQMPIDWRALAGYADRSDVFDAVAGWYDREVAMDADDRVTTARVSVVTPNYFRTIGVPMALGAGLPSTESDADPVGIVIAYSFWKEKLGGATDVIGRQVMVDGQPFTVRGVVTERFVGASVDDRIPRRLAWVSLSGGRRLGELAPFEGVVARWKDGVNRSEAAAAVSAIASRNGALIGRTTTGGIRSLRDRPRGTRDDTMAIVAVTVVIGALMLLITCTNVATLFLVRAASRRREIAVRLSLGASRGRVVRQLLTEAGLIALAAAAGACFVLFGLTRGLRATLATLPFDPTPRGSTILFAIAIAVATALLFGLSPALHATRFSLGDVLKDATAVATGSRSRGQARFVVMQIALTQPFLIAIAAAVLQSVGSFQSPAAAEFERRVLTVPMIEYRSRSRSRDVVTDPAPRALASLPGVVGVTVDFGRPLSRVATYDGGRAGRAHTVDAFIAGAGWSEMHRIKLVAGRFITADDERQQRSVIVLNTRTARALFGDASPIGRTVMLGEPPYGKTREVIGVQAYGGEERPLVVVDRSFSRADRPTYSIETRGPAAAITPAVRRVMREVAPQAEIGWWMATLAEARERDEREGRQLLAANIAAAGLALFLAAIGLYAIIAFAVRDRTREIGVRIAVGARHRDLINLFVGRGLRLAGLGIAIGLPLSVVAVRGFQVATDGISAVDSISVAATLVVVLGVAGLATWIPARRATSVDVVVALRSE